MTMDRVWCPWPGRLFAIDTGSLRYAYAFGVAVGTAGRAAFITALGFSVTVFDGEDDLPFDRFEPDAPGFWIGRHWFDRRYLPRYYVAFNRGKDR